MQRACIPEAGTPRRRKVGDPPCSASAGGSPLGLDTQASDPDAGRTVVGYKVGHPLRLTPSSAVWCDVVWCGVVW